MAIVFKFGGASLKDSESVKNMAGIVNSYNDELIIVVSAMGKITRALHKLTDLYFNQQNFDTELTAFWSFHYDIINGLNLTDDKILHQHLEKIKEELQFRLSHTPSDDFDFEYDQIVCQGELISSVIVSRFLNSCSIINQWIDIRKSLKTNSFHRDARINWNNSEELIKKEFDFTGSRVFVTQGFIASADNTMTTTLGLEGSDYTAAALSYFIDAQKLIVWKDVAGFFNSDPKEYQNVIKLDAVSYREAVELAYYGAKIIHPKTIKPLENKNIPLWIKSFVNPNEEGTVITASTPNKTGVYPMVPVFISKNDQILISIAPFDFSFIAEDNLEHIFSILSKFRIKVNLMQNSAISFSICTDYDKAKVIPAIEMLKANYKVLYNSGLTLITIRHFDEETIKQTTQGREVFVQQKSRHMTRFVIK